MIILNGFELRESSATWLKVDQVGVGMGKRCDVELYEIMRTEHYERWESEGEWLMEWR